MIKRRFSQRALAYGLSAVLALSAVLLSLYLPDTLARLGDGALLRQAHEEPFSWTGYRAREWREGAQLFLLDEARSGGAATLSLGSAENAPGTSHGGRGAFSPHSAGCAAGWCAGG